jgi:hypothetical protein
LTPYICGGGFGLNKIENIHAKFNMELVLNIWLQTSLDKNIWRNIT